MDLSLPGSSVHGIIQAKLAQWVVISYCRGSFWPKGWTHISCVSCIGRFFTTSSVQFSSVQSLSCGQLFVSFGLQHTRLPCPLPISRACLNIQPSHLLPSPPPPPAFNLSQHQDLFQWVSSSHRWPKYWSFSFSTSPSNDNSGLIYYISRHIYTLMYIEYTYVYLFIQFT